MKKYVVSVKDSLTGMEILLDMCSYNEACFYLNQHGFNWATAETKVDTRKNRVLIYNLDEDDNITGRLFVYDDNRGLLLGD